MRHLFLYSKRKHTHKIKKNSTWSFGRASASTYSSCQSLDLVWASAFIFLLQIFVSLTKHIVLKMRPGYVQSAHTSWSLFANICLIFGVWEQHLSHFYKRALTSLFNGQMWQDVIDPERQTKLIKKETREEGEVAVWGGRWSVLQDVWSLPSSKHKGV